MLNFNPSTSPTKKFAMANFSQTMVVSRLMIVSREAKKNQAVRDERVSYVFTGSTALKFVIALNKPP